MKPSRKWQVVGTAVVFIFLVIGFVLTAKKEESTATSSAGTEQSQVRESTSTVFLTVPGIYQHETVPITSGETVLQVLQIMNAKDPSLHLVTKDYEGLGTLVVGMGSTTNGTGNKYWQYKVNGTMPQVGADVYKLKNDDSVEWFFGASEF